MNHREFLRLAVHPTKSWEENHWSHIRKRYYKRKTRFIYCTKCKQWGWGLPGNHSGFPLAKYDNYKWSGRTEK